MKTYYNSLCTKMPEKLEKHGKLLLFFTAIYFFAAGAFIIIIPQIIK